MTVTMQFILAGLIAYLIGSIPTGVIATKLAGAPDVRYSGSGHTGGTNAMRQTNAWIGTAVVIIDGLKGLIAWAIAYLILLGHGWALPLAGTLAVIGHCWPIYTRFHGGMGLATAGSMIFVITPITLAFLIPAWVILFFLIFKKQYSPRSVALALLVSIPLRLWLVSADIFVNWFLILVGLVLVLRHLPEWNRKV